MHPLSSPLVPTHSLAASKYSDRGSIIDVQIQLGTPATAPSGAATSPQTVIVTVADNGIGLSEDAQETLFQPFKQAQRSAGGTGLGLYSLAKRIEALGGKCGVRNRSDGQQGSVFWFSFPYRPDTVAAEEAAFTTTIVAMTTTVSATDVIASSVPSTNSSSIDFLATLYGSHNKVAIDGDFEPAPAQRDVSSGRPGHTGDAQGEKGDEKEKWEGDEQLSSTVPAHPTFPRQLPSTADSTAIAPLRILLTDDSASILKVTKRFLLANGHFVETADNGNQSLERLKRERAEFDMHITDLQMPVRLLRATCMGCGSHTCSPCLLSILSLCVLCSSLSVLLPLVSSCVACCLLD